MRIIQIVEIEQGKRGVGRREVRMKRKKKKKERRCEVRMKGKERAPLNITGKEEEINHVTASFHRLQVM